jgi:hypothetical protein
MTFKELATKVFGDKNKLLLRREWPQALSVPADQEGGIIGLGAKNRFWDKVKKLREYTDSGSDKFSDEHRGSTGWEYELMMIFVNGQFYYSTPSTTRNYTEVSSSHRLHIDVSQDPKSGVILDRIYLGEKQVGTLRYQKEEERQKRKHAIQDGKYLTGFFAHFHSHPQVQVPEVGKRIYTFFSTEDMDSFARGSYPIMGLVTDRLWLLGRTQEFMDHYSSQIHRIGAELGEVTRVELLGEDALLKTAGEVLSRYELAAYTSRFGGKLERIS